MRFSGTQGDLEAGAALALLNFFWSLGAVATGLLLAGLLPRIGWREPVRDLAALLALTGAASALWSQSQPSASAGSLRPAMLVPLWLVPLMLALRWRLPAARPTAKGRRTRLYN